MTEGNKGDMNKHFHTVLHPGLPDLGLAEHPLHHVCSGFPDLCHNLEGLEALLQQMPGVPLFAPGNDSLAPLLGHNTLTPQQQHSSKQVLPDVVQALGCKTLVTTLLLSVALPREEDSTGLLVGPPTGNICFVAPADLHVHCMKAGLADCFAAAQRQRILCLVEVQIV